MTDMLDTIRFRIPNDRDVPLSIYTPLIFYSVGERPWPQKYSVVAYARMLPLALLDKLYLQRRRRVEGSELRTYANTKNPPQINGTDDVISWLVHKREQVVARNMRVNCVFDDLGSAGLELWATAELTPYPPLPGNVDLRDRVYPPAAMMLTLKFLELVRS